MTQAQPSPVSITEPKPPAPTLQGWPVLRLGFRPFYIGTALLACVSVPLWIAAFVGAIELDLPFSPLLWHGHEMLFGFAAGVIMGFLLTAVRAWTGLATPRGPVLGGLIALWLAARVTAVTGPYALFAVLDVLLLPIVAVLLLRVLVKARNKRNPPLIALMLIMGAANLVFHLSVMGVIEVPAISALYAQLGLVIMVVTVMAGRVVPIFTRNVTPGMKPNAPAKTYEMAVLAATALALVLWVWGAPALLTGVVSAVAAVLHVGRVIKWQPQVTLTRPILWILHLAYAWVPIGFVMLAMVQAGWVGTSLAVHAFAVGAVGGLIIGMLTRTARGHTARPLNVTKGETLAYVLVMVAAVIRAVVPAAAPATYVTSLIVASAMWALAFAIYLVIYTPWLTSRRRDGKDG